jgi:hypothetical protein
MACRLAFCLLLYLVVSMTSAVAANPDTKALFPRSYHSSSGKVLIHGPSISAWDQFRQLSASTRIEVTAAGSSQTWNGTVSFKADTVVDLESRQVTLERRHISAMKFAGGPAPENIQALAREALGNGLQSVPLDHVLRSLPKDFSIPDQAKAPPQLNFQPPRIVVSNKPTRLMLIDGPPANVPIDGLEMEFVVNTDWTIFHDPGQDSWYILDDGHWLTNNMLSSGSWISTIELPRDFLTLQVNSDWPEVAAAMPPRKPEAPPLPLIISYEPSELVLIDGDMKLEAIGAAGLEYVTNSHSDLFRLGGRYYLLVSGRWFSTKNVKRMWYSVKNLPAEFAAIPEDHPRGRVLASVSGTPAARLAEIEASIPRTAVVTMNAASALEVPYVGEPSFVEIQGTGLRRAENTPFQVIMNNNFYYLCHDGAWFSSSNPKGPWRTAREVPEAIYTIPPTDPAFNVTFVELESFDDSTGEAAYKSTSGYYSRYWTGSSMVYGTGWYYPGYYNRSVYWRYPHTYGYGYGAWGPYYPYPYRYNYSATFEVNRPDKDWQWDLNGNKRAVYDYGPRNYIGGGTYVMPDSDNFKAGGKQ